MWTFGKMEFVGLFLYISCESVSRFERLSNLFFISLLSAFVMSTLLNKYVLLILFLIVVEHVNLLNLDWSRFGGFVKIMRCLMKKFKFSSHP